MSTKAILQLVLALFVIAVLCIVIYFQSNLFQQKTNSIKAQSGRNNEKTTTEEKETMSVDRIQTLEDEIAELKSTQDEQKTSLKKLSSSTTSPTPKNTNSSHEILNTAQAQGSSFSTSSNSYTPTGVFTNISCSQKCILWINYYTSTKNNSTNNTNSYALLINGQDTGIFIQDTLQIANSPQSISLNTTQQMNSGTHTVEIQAKTSGGTLQQDISYLQVMAIAQ